MRELSTIEANTTNSCHAPYNRDTFSKSSVYMDVKPDEVEYDVKPGDVEDDVKPIDFEMDVEPVVVEVDVRE